MKKLLERLLPLFLIILLCNCGQAKNSVATATQTSPTPTAKVEQEPTPFPTVMSTKIPSSKLGRYSFTNSQGKCITEGLRGDTVKQVILTPIEEEGLCGVVDTQDELFGSATQEFNQAIARDKASVGDGLKVYPFTPFGLWMSPIQGGIQPEGFQRPGPYNFTGGNVQAHVFVSNELAPHIKLLIFVKDEKARNYQTHEYQPVGGINKISMDNIGSDKNGGDADVTDIIAIEIMVRIAGNYASKGGGLLSNMSKLTYSLLLNQ